MTVAEANTIDEREALAYLCQHSLYDFVREFWPLVETADYIDGWHIRCICEHLEAVTSGQISRLLINIPPGCSKSLLVSVFWPCWEWARDASIRFFFASYDQKLSTRDSMKCRDLIGSPLYQSLWGSRFTVVEDQKMFYQTDQGGYRMATSVGGHGTGEHPDRIVADDPHNVQQAESDVERQSVLDWWDRTMATRGVARNARRVIIMQRLHQSDLFGHVLSKGDYVHIVLPMRYEPNRMKPTPLGWVDPRRQQGELLAPKQFDEAKVADQEKNLGAYGTAGQLQQRPAPLGGGIFKETFFINRVKAAPYDARRSVTGIKLRRWKAASPSAL
jgi:hypothetical protein